MKRKEKLVEERKKKKEGGCEAHMFMLSVGKSEDETRDPKCTGLGHSQLSLIPSLIF